MRFPACRWGLLETICVHPLASLVHYVGGGLRQLLHPTLSSAGRVFASIQRTSQSTQNESSRFGEYLNESGKSRSTYGCIPKAIGIKVEALAQFEAPEPLWPLNRRNLWPLCLPGCPCWLFVRCGSLRVGRSKNGGRRWLASGHLQLNICIFVGGEIGSRLDPFLFLDQSWVHLGSILGHLGDQRRARLTELGDTNSASRSSFSPAQAP